MALPVRVRALDSRDPDRSPWRTAAEALDEHPALLVGRPAGRRYRAPWPAVSRICNDPRRIAVLARRPAAPRSSVHRVRSQPSRSEWSRPHTVATVRPAMVEPAVTIRV